MTKLIPFLCETLRSPLSALRAADEIFGEYRGGGYR
jgi:hypothetical protein